MEGRAPFGAIGGLVGAVAGLVLAPVAYATLIVPAPAHPVAAAALPTAEPSAGTGPRPASGGSGARGAVPRQRVVGPREPSTTSTTASGSSHAAARQLPSSRSAPTPTGSHDDPGDQGDPTAATGPTTLRHLHQRDPVVAPVVSSADRPSRTVQRPKWREATP